MEELQEADVLWPDRHHDSDRDHSHAHHQQQLEGKQPRADAARRGGGTMRPAVSTSSAPVAIPVARPSTPTSRARGYDNGGGDEAPFVPPHVLAAAGRRCWEERAACSVCEGHGRTLKGRDLRYVRTAVLRMTGFLES